MNVLRAQGLPRVVDGGEPRDLLLDVRVRGKSGGVVALPVPGEPAALASGTIGVPAVGPVEIALVGRGSSFFRGEVRDDLTAPARLGALAGRLALRLEILPDVPERFPSARGGPHECRIDLTIEPIDPDRRSGPARSIAAARPLALGRIAEGRVDLPAQAATDFYALDVDEPGEAILVLYRRQLGSRVEAVIYGPNFERDELGLTAGPGPPRLSHATGRLPRGRVIARVRQTGGDTGTPYEVFVVSRRDVGDLVSALFRLIGREAAREGSGFLDTESFTEQIAETLLELNPPLGRLARALVEQLGNRVAVAKRLAIRLLARQLATPEGVTALEEAMARGGSEGRTAALLLATKLGKDERVTRALRESVVDPDPYMRARALRTAALLGDADLAEELARACERDEALSVQRAVVAALEAARAIREKRP